MDERALLLAKIDALVQQLNWAESSLQNAKVEPRFRDAASVGFAVLLDQRRKELSHLQKSIAQTGCYAGSWQQLRIVSDSCREFFKESLEFLGGAMLRNLHTKNDICKIADALLERLSKKTEIEWKRVTLLAESHFFTESTGLIRLPFPDYGIWNLPISVHELGHFIGPRISDRKGGFPFQTRLAAIERKYEEEQGSEEEMAQEISHLREFFSDLFAVYALGPAYACSCILLNWDPQDDTACQDSETHPSHAKRVHFILRALTEMSKATDGDPYHNFANNLGNLWQRNLTSAGRITCLDQKNIPLLNYLLLELYSIVDQFIPTLRYAGWNRAVELSGEFPLKSKMAKVLARKYEIPDVLNAVWLWRLRQKAENKNLVRKVNLEAIALCR